MAVTKETVRNAGGELGEMITLVLDGTPNKEQITEFATKGFAAVQALAAMGIPKENLPKVATNLVESILAKLNETVLALPEV